MCSRCAPCRRIGALLLLVLALVLAQLRGDGRAEERPTYAPAEYQVKAAFVYNFMKFVEWPSGEQLTGQTLAVCILGDVPLAPFEELNGREIMGRRIAVKELASPKDARSCQILFIAESRSAGLAGVLDAVGGAPVLTIGDTEGFAKRGVMINMYLENKHVRFEVNAESSRAAGLRISAKLMKLAGKVYGTLPDRE